MKSLLTRLTAMALTLVLICGLIPADALASSSGNSVPAGFVDKGNEILEDILEYLPKNNSQPSIATFRSVNKKKIEVVFVVDSTGSMSGAIANVKKNIAAFAQCFSGEQYELRLGLVEYKDTTADGLDSTIVHTLAHTPWMDTAGFIQSLTNVSVDGGGDDSETPIDALGYLTGGSFNWSSDAYKYAVLVTDAGSKTTNRHGISSLDEMAQQLANRSISTSVITKSGCYSTYGEFAAQTGGIVADIYGNFSDILIAYANSIMEETQGTASYTLRVLCATTGLPIQGATIKSGSTVFEPTNSKGLVTLELKSSQLRNLSVSATNYETLSNIGYDLTADTITDIKLSMKQDEDGTVLLSVNDFINPGTGDANVSGPSLSILGHNVDLLNFPVKMDLRIFDKANIKMEIDQEKKTVKFMFGPYAKTPEGGYWKEEWQSIQNMVKTLTGEKLGTSGWNKFQQARKWVKKAQNFGFPAEGYILGYGTLSWASGKPELTESGLLMALKTKNLLPATWRLVPIAPWAFAKFGVILEASANTSLYRNENGKIGWFNNIKVKGDAKPSLSVNAGVEKVAYAGLGVEGDIAVAADFPWESLEESFAADLNASAFLEIKVLGFKNKWSQQFAKLNLYPDFGLGVGWNAFAMQRNAISDYQVIPRAQRPFSLRGINLPENIYKEEYAYEDSRPTLINLGDDRMMLLWLQDDTDRRSINKSSFVYSIFDGSTWSKPAAIANDGTADYIYTAVLQNGKVHVLWENATKAFDNDDSLNDVVENLELSYAVYDGTFFSAPIQLNSNSGKAMLLPTLAVNNGQVTAVWAENSDNSPTLSEGTNTIYYANLNGNVWNTASVLVSGVQQLENMTAGVWGGKTAISYVENAGEVSKLVVSVGYSTPELLSESTFVGDLQHVEDRIYWTDGEAFYSASSLDSIRTELEYVSGSRHKVIANGTSKAIIFEDADGYSNNIGVYYVQGSSWSEPTLLADEDGRIEMTSAIMDANSQITMAYQYGILSGDEEETIASNHMLVSEYYPRSNLNAERELYYDEMKVAAGNTIELTMYVKNEGTAPSTSFVAVLMDEKGRVIDQVTDSDGLKIGEESFIDFEYTLPAEIKYHELKAELRDSHGNTVAGDNVQAFATIGYGDLSISSVNLERTESGATAHVVIQNNGYANMRNNSLTLKVGGDVGVVVSTSSINDLKRGEEKTISVSIPNDKLVATDQYDYKIIRAEVSSETEEAVLYNNYCESLLDPIPVSSVTLTKRTLEMSVGQSTTISYTCLPANAANKSVVWHSDNLEVVDVDPVTGIIRALREGSATITAVTEQGNLSDKCTVVVDSGSLSVKSVQIFGDNVVAVGGETILTAVITPETALNKTVQWFCDNDNCVITPGMDGQLLVEGIKEGTSKITVVTADGGYTDEISMSITADSKTPLTISFQPINQYVVVGQCGTFTIQATGDGLTYQWYINRNNGNGWRKLDGAVRAIYITSVTDLDCDGFKYYCKVTDQYGNTISSNEAVLHVTTAPILPETGDSSGSLSVKSVQIFGDNVVAVGGETILTAVITPETALNKTVQWFCDNDNCVITPGMDGQLLVEGIKEGTSKITVVTTDGGYTDEISMSITADSETPLTISFQPINQYVVVGQCGTFTIQATGDGLTYQWYINRNNGNGWRKLDGAVRATYITSVTDLDCDGFKYYCKVTDQYGNTISSNEAVLHVTTAPILPETGDSSVPMLWLALSMLSMLGIQLIRKKAYSK